MIAPLNTHGASVNIDGSVELAACYDIQGVECGPRTGKAQMCWLRLRQKGKGISVHDNIVFSGLIVVNICIYSMVMRKDQ